VKQAIIKAFDKVEQEWTSFAKEGFIRGYPRMASVGSCALIALVIDDTLYIANCGDSKAMMLQSKSSHNYTALSLSKTFNANKLYEQERLQK
jgi:serine/threonine protein phosphatase PrpC